MDIIKKSHEFSFKIVRVITIAVSNPVNFLVNARLWRQSIASGYSMTSRLSAILLLSPPSNIFYTRARTLYIRSELKCKPHENTAWVLFSFRILQMEMDSNLKKNSRDRRGGYFPPSASYPMLIMYPLRLRGNISMGSALADPYTVFLKSLSIYIFKLVHVRNTVTEHTCCIFILFPFQFRPHELKKHIRINHVSKLMSNVFVCNSNYDSFFLNRPGCSFVIIVLYYFIKKNIITCFSKWATFVKLYH